MPTLQWLTRDPDLSVAEKVPYRLLEDVPDLGGGDRETGNMLIQGDNLDALKALLPFFAGQVKCIFIDPPYNTRSAFEHYDDNIEHSQWLAMMWPRLDLLRELLSEDGSIWVTIDDNEAHYLKVIMDEVFGRKNFVTSIAWQKAFSKKNKALISGSHDHILVAAKNISAWQRNLLPRDDSALAAFKNLDHDKRGLWQSVAYSVQSEDSERRKEYRYLIELPSGRKVGPPPGRHWNGLPERTENLQKDGRLWFGRGGDSLPRLKVFLSEVQGGIVPDTWWSHEFAGSNQDSKKEMLELFPDTEPFGTPKPERLMQRIIQIATNPRDCVLDSFLGSGTTAAVAHKLDRRYIGIEVGEHAVTYCAPRLKKVLEGEQGGISEILNWKGGGGFRFYRLGEPAFDAEGRIRDGIRFRILAAHIWFSETGTPWNGKGKSPLLGFSGERAFALLYNGILGDKTPKGGNLLTRETLAIINERIAKKKCDFKGPLTIYGEASRLSAVTLARKGIVFKQTPYEVKARK